MEIHQQFIVDKPIAVVWAALSDIRLVASCLPGAEIDSISDNGTEVKGRIRTKLGPISAAFSGKGVITRNDPSYTGVVEGSGSDKNSASRVKITLAYKATPNDTDTSTATDVTANVILTGALVQFGKGALMNDIATAMTAEFTKNLHCRIAAPAGSIEGEVDRHRPEPLVPSAELRPLKLLWTVIKARLMSLLGRSG